MADVALRSVYSVERMRARSRRTLPRLIYDFVEGGSDDEITLRANLESLARIRFRPRMAVYVAQPDLRTSVLGSDLAFPIMLAPCGGLTLLHPDGQVAAARAAAAGGTRAVIGTLSGTALEDPVDSGAVSHWFQLYNLGGRSGTEVLVDRARRAGYAALVVTVDTPVVGHKERDIRNGGIQPGGMPVERVTVGTALRFAPKVWTRPGWVYRFARAGFPLGHPNFAQLSPDGRAVTTEEAMAKWMAEPVTWKDLSWIRERWGGPLAIKGILSGDDARTAVDHGADAVIISNHGGRQLDGTPATIDVLPEVVAAVGHRAAVLIDSGFRRGADVARALALGARAVLVGRPYLYGLAAGGEAGVARVLDLLHEELRRTMQLLGCASIRDLDPSWLDVSTSPSCGFADQPALANRSRY